jgi:hypothetical protein
MTQKESADVFKKALTVIMINITIALLHVINIGAHLNGKFFIYYKSFFSDLLLPFGFYFLLCMQERRVPVLRKWWIKAGLVFLAAALAESLQGMGIYALGITFDPLDFVMYASGVLAAALLDTQVLARILPFWRESAALSKA